MDQVLELTLLFDFYKPMLTEKQQLVMELFHEEDYSLAEIAEKLEISRQAVYDTFKKAKLSLLHCEEKLGLLARFVESGEAADAIDMLIDEIVADMEVISDDNDLRSVQSRITDKLRSIRELTEKIRYNQ